MVSKTGKVFIGISVVLVAVIAAACFIFISWPSSSSCNEVALKTYPSGDEITVPAREPFSIDCVGSSCEDDKFTSIVWLNKNGYVVPEGLRKIGGNSLMLTFNYPEPQDSGLYICRAVYNKKLTLEKAVRITFYSKEVEEIATFNVEVGNVSPNSVQFLIDDACDSVESIEVKYHERRETTRYFDEWRCGEDLVVTNLKPGGYYFFQFRKLPSENGAWTRAYEVTLLPDKPELLLLDMKEGKVKLQWYRSTEEVMLGTIDAYELKYFPVTEEGNVWIPGDCGPIIAEIPTCQGVDSYIISDLSPNTYYQIHLRAHTASGYSEPSSQQVFIYE